MNVFLQIDNAPMVLQINGVDAQQITRWMTKAAADKMTFSGGGADTAEGFLINWAQVGTVLVTGEYDPPPARWKPTVTIEFSDFVEQSS